MGIPLQFPTGYTLWSLLVDPSRQELVLAHTPELRHLFRDTRVILEPEDLGHPWSREIAEHMRVEDLAAGYGCLIDRQGVDGTFRVLDPARDAYALLATAVVNLELSLTKRLCLPGSEPVYDGSHLCAPRADVVRTLLPQNHLYLGVLQRHQGYELIPDSPAM